eukprot:362901-Chlamydomonas_euryale.AAC.3
MGDLPVRERRRRDPAALQGMRRAGGGNRRRAERRQRRVADRDAGRVKQRLRDAAHARVERGAVWRGERRRRKGAGGGRRAARERRVVGCHERAWLAADGDSGGVAEQRACGVWEAAALQ